MNTLFVAGAFDRTEGGLRCEHWTGSGDVAPGREPAWMSSESLDGRIRISVPKEGGMVARLWLIGSMPPPTAPSFQLVRIEVLDSTRVREVRVVNGAAVVLAGTDPGLNSLGDGTGIEFISCVNTDRGYEPVHRISIDLTPTMDAEHVILLFGRNLNYALMDVYFEIRAAIGCPFHSQSQGVSLAELGSVVRTGDRLRFDKALRQFRKSLARSEDLDEARGLALTFLAVIAAALLELGAPRSLHRFQLDAARSLDKIREIERVAEKAIVLAQELVEARMAVGDAGVGNQVKHALSFVDRHFAQALSDDEMARELGLSTSHFRQLFRQVTGEPFHRYLVGVRLEKAKQLIVDHRVPVAEAAQMVGFVSPAHFSRAFLKRFNCSPSKLR